MAKANIKKVLSKYQKLGFTQKEIREITGIPERTQRYWKQKNISKEKIRKHKLGYDLLSENYEKIKYKRKKGKKLSDFIKKTEIEEKETVLGDKIYQIAIFNYKKPITELNEIDLIDFIDKHIDKIKLRFLYLTAEITYSENKNTIFISISTDLKENYKELIANLIYKIEDVFKIEEIKPGLKVLFKYMIGSEETLIDDYLDNMIITKIHFKFWDFKR